MKRIAIIGAGPAGIFATLLLADFDGEVILFDQNKRIGEKLRITGGGRMNVTNRVFGVEEFTSQSSRELKNLFKSKWVNRREEILAELGIEYVWEKDRAILKSGDAVAEVERLNNKIVQQKNAEFRGNATVFSVEPDEEKFAVEYEKNGTKSREIFDKVILSGGGMFRMFCQSNEQKNYSIPRNLQHTITKVDPSLSPIRIKNNPFKDLSGTSLVLQLIAPETKTKMTQDAIFSHTGMSGPVVLDFSSYLPSSGEFLINFLPQISEEDFFAGFLKLRQGKNLFRRYLREFLPKKVSDWHLDHAGISLTANIADISKEKVKILRKNLFRFEVKNAATFSYSACWTTKGGVNLSEINVATMESKIHPNLFFAGEILDVNGLCGGYNISFAAISAKILSERVLNY